MDNSVSNPINTMKAKAIFATIFLCASASYYHRTSIAKPSTLLFPKKSTASNNHDDQPPEQNRLQKGEFRGSDSIDHMRSLEEHNNFHYIGDFVDEDIMKKIEADGEAPLGFELQEKANRRLQEVKENTKSQETKKDGREKKVTPQEIKKKDEPQQLKQNIKPKELKKDNIPVDKQKKEQKEVIPHGVLVDSTEMKIKNAKESSPNIGREENAYYYYYYYDENGKPFVVKGRKADHFTRLSTGSFANCDQTMPTSTKKGDSKKRDPGRDSGMVVISCREIHYRAPLAEIERGGAPIVVGVLSGAGGKGPIHRDSIRSTWAYDRSGVYFLVAGPWDEIAEEFEKYRDLIWIDEEEVYEGEKSVLPFKTESFMNIIYKHALPGSFEYVFKTDDDSYLDILRLELLLLGRQKHHDLAKWHYWGCCTTRQFAPLRDATLKWSISRELYPEDMYPLYCQGAGFAVSRDFLECMVTGDHLKNFRYNPFEDVSVGLLAERCKVMPISDPDMIRQYRSDEGLTKMLAEDKVEEIKLLPKPVMEDRLLQHRVKTHFDMYYHHVCATMGC